MHVQKGGGAGWNTRTCLNCTLSCVSDRGREELSVALEQLATHIPDMVLYRSHQAPVPQITHCYGVMMFLDVSGDYNSTHPMYSFIELSVLQVLLHCVKTTAARLSPSTMEQINSRPLSTTI